MILIYCVPVSALFYPPSQLFHWLSFSSTAQPGQKNLVKVLKNFLNLENGEFKVFSKKNTQRGLNLKTNKKWRSL